MNKLSYDNLLNFKILGSFKKGVQSCLFIVNYPFTKFIDIHSNPLILNYISHGIFPIYVYLCFVNQNIWADFNKV